MTKETEMSGVSLRHRAPMAAIKLARRAFANTPVQKLPMVGWLYRRTVRLVWGDQEFTVGFRGMRLTVPGGDHIFTAGVRGGFYERIELDLFELLAAHSRTIVDVGANIGIYACVGAARLPAEGQLIAFEPVPGNLDVLHRNLAQNGLSERVKVEQLAVGEAPGETVIHLVEASGNHSLAAGVVVNSRGSMSVQVTSLDAYLGAAGAPGPVDLLKIDVEGYDGYVLRGAATVLREQQPTLLVEFVPSHLANAGFPGEEFLNTIFAAYPHVFLIDEPRQRLVRCERAELDGYGDKSMNLNLVAVHNPEHLRIIQGYRTDPSG